MLKCCVTTQAMQYKCVLRLRAVSYFSLISRARSIREWRAARNEGARPRRNSNLHNYKCRRKGRQLAVLCVLLLCIQSALTASKRYIKNSLRCSRNYSRGIEVLAGEPRLRVAREKIGEDHARWCVARAFPPRRF